ncbi:zf-HC2 domain-containing protein [Neobacillus rhizosphaerae]|uniref:zf-HC2 domain-containing protein n=1 Tax=Neobacillus rhizosphaerae TaxID=2880965 RepID=UPI003D2E420C
MNNNCYIVRDLLPSYIDKLCSHESNQFIEEHISSCSECKNVLDTMKEEVEGADELDQVKIQVAKKPFQKVADFFKAQKKLTKYVLIAALLSLVAGAGFLVNSMVEWKENENEINKLEVVEQERADIMSDVFDALGVSNDVTAHEEKQLFEVFNKYKNKLKLLAIFPAEDVEDWIKENPSVTHEPTTIFPIDYKKAAKVIGTEGMIERKDRIIPSDYDFGTVVMANTKWVIQYEYKSSYEPKIERHHQLKYYGPSIWTIFLLPILLFAIGSVLIIVWWFLKKHIKQLKDVIG